MRQAETYGLAPCVRRVAVRIADGVAYLRQPRAGRPIGTEAGVIRIGRLGAQIW